MSQTNTNTNNGHNQTKILGDVDGAKESPTAVAAAIAVTIVETIDCIIFIQREN